MDFLCNMYGNSPNIWMDDLTGFDRLRVITNAMTRIRVCAADGALDFNFKGELPDVPEGYVAWFDWPDRASDSQPIIFGHWSALGLQQRNNVFALDTGCLWGGALTAMCLETKQIIQVPSNLKDKPRKVHH
jgi:bis(5'-nucleosyl)-tetraphosphatase (symmetrical)